MNLLIWICLALAAWPSVFAKYLTREIVFKLPTTKHNSSNPYFGYSITYDEVHKKLVISAPMLSDIGEVFDCNIDNQACAKIPRDNIRKNTGDGGYNYKHEYWFGATVKAGRDYVLMCAPRYTELSKRFNSYITQGRCYAHENGKLTERRIISEEDRLEDPSKKMETTMDSFGWSVDISSTDSVIVGGPGMYHGRAMIYDRPQVVPQVIKASNGFKLPAFNFGYAVASGTFIRNDVSYAVSSPYGPGEVQFFNKGADYLRRLDKKIDTDLIGSMFGAVLCAAKLHGRRTDLLVGAPTYATKDTYNKGAVYVYLTVILKKAPQFHRKIVGNKPGSMFGSAIVNVGDINADNMDDIAIGAPFENNGRGVVYLYSGAALSNKILEGLTYLQKIEPGSSYGESFGMSLSPLLDYDENGCKELAIGSPYKDTVVLLRCLTAVLVKTSVIFPNVQGRTSSRTTNFDLDLCLKVTYPSLLKTVTGRIITTVEINHDHALLADAGVNGTVSLKTDLDVRKSVYCKKVPFILPANGKYEMEIGFLISSELEVDPMELDDFKSSRVILSDSSDLIIKKSLWAAECAGNKSCEPILDLKPHISFLNVEPYTIGSSKTETMTITMTNVGDVAYDSCVRVHIDGANVLQPGGCVYEPSTDRLVRLMCEPPKPLWNQTSWTTGQIEVEMVHLTNLHKSINITMLLYNRCTEIDNVTQSEQYSIPVRADSRGITAKGETDIGNTINMTEVEIKENGKRIKHVYTITNTGPTNWEKLPVLVQLQKQPFIKYDADASVTMVFSSSTSSNIYSHCQFESEDAISMSYLCVVEILTATIHTAKILVPMYILPGTLEGLLDKDKNVTIMSDVKLVINDLEHKSERIISTITLQEAPVPFETIIIAIVVGLCILIVIALILYRVGFLQRKRRERLQKLRKSVKRQTILRRSTMPSQGQVADDRRKILEGMQEENEQAPNQK